MTEHHIAKWSIGTVHLQEGAVTEHVLCENSVNAAHLQEGAITGHALSAQSVGAEHLRDKAVTSRSLNEQSVGAEHLQDGAVTERALAEGSVGAAQLQERAVTKRVLAEGSVGGKHLQAGSVHAEHLADGTITLEKLAIQPVLSVRKKPAQTVQQFGMASFEFVDEEPRLEMLVPLEQEYSSIDYAIVAMTNHPDCYVVLSEKFNGYAMLEVINTKPDSRRFGDRHLDCRRLIR